jgi:hypothetical protein
VEVGHSASVHQVRQEGKARHKNHKPGTDAVHKEVVLRHLLNEREVLFLA